MIEIFIIIGALIFMINAAKHEGLSFIKDWTVFVLKLIAKKAKEPGFLVVGSIITISTYVLYLIYTYTPALLSHLNELRQIGYAYSFVCITYILCIIFVMLSNHKFSLAITIVYILALSYNVCVLAQCVMYDLYLIDYLFLYDISRQVDIALFVVLIGYWAGIDWDGWIRANFTISNSCHHRISAHNHKMGDS